MRKSLKVLWHFILLPGCLFICFFGGQALGQNTVQLINGNDGRLKPDDINRNYSKNMIVVKSDIQFYSNVLFDLEKQRNEAVGRGLSTDEYDEQIELLVNKMNSITESTDSKSISLINEQIPYQLNQSESASTGELSGELLVESYKKQRDELIKEKEIALRGGRNIEDFDRKINKLSRLINEYDGH
jgi:hypothetical protein